MKLQAYFCYWLHQNSLKTSTSEVLIWWFDHHKWVKQKQLLNWSLLPRTACQALTRHSQVPEAACHWSCFSPATGVRGTAQLPPAATEHSSNACQHLVMPAQRWPFPWCFRYQSSLSLPPSVSIPTRPQTWNKNGLAAISSRVSGHKSRIKLTLGSCLSLADG